MERRSKTAVIVEKKEGIVYITINRPDVRNALNLEALNELNQALLEYRDDNELRAAIITGAGDRAFCSGMDTRDPALRSLSGEVRDKPWRMPWNIFKGVEVWKPLIAAINGFALGGGLALALACDLRVASENATFGCPEITFGAGPPAWGQTQQLARAVPRCKAIEILLLGLPIDAQEAYRIGLVNRVVPPAQVMAIAQEWAVRLCGFAPLGVQLTKEAIIRGSELSLDDGLRLEDLLARYSRASGSVQQAPKRE